MRLKKKSSRRKRPWPNEMFVKQLKAKKQQQIVTAEAEAEQMKIKA